MQADYTSAGLRRKIYNIIYRMTCFWFRIIGRKTIDQILGLENLPTSGPFIVITNHLSYMDDFLVAYAIRKYYGEKLYIPTNIKAFNTPLRNLWHTAAGGVPIDPNNRQQSYQALHQLMQDGKIILMFPEGTRSDGNALLEFKFGAYNLAEKAGVPIVNAGLIDTHEVLPKGRHFFVKGKKASVYFDKPVLPKEAKKLGATTLRDQSKKKINEIVYTHRDLYFSNHVHLHSEEHLGRMAERKLERLLDANEAGDVRRRDVMPILEMLSLRQHLHVKSVYTSVQFARVYGFSIMGLPRFFAAFRLRALHRVLMQTLQLDPMHPYANYTLGLFNAKVPWVFGGDKLVAFELFRNAFSNAAEYGIDPARFVISYAEAAWKTKNPALARQLIEQHFGEHYLPSTERTHRRMTRAIKLLKQIPTS